jgi:transposase
LPDKEVVIAKTEALAVLQKFELLDEIELLYGDEAGFNLTPKIPYGWQKKGIQTGLPAEKGGTTNVFGMISRLGSLHTYSTPESINSAFMIESITHFCQFHQKKRTILVLDNASWHTSAAFTAQIPIWEAQELFVFYLPTYSPHLNFAETLWRKTKYEWLQLNDSKDAETLRAALQRIFSNYGTSYRINTPQLE